MKKHLQVDITGSTDNIQFDPEQNKEQTTSNDGKILHCSSIEIGLESITFKTEHLSISNEGIKNTSTGEKITETIDPSDLDFGECIGKGASGKVNLAIYKPKNIILAVKSINVYDEGKRSQLKNDLNVLNENKCPFLVHFYGALYKEGNVKLLLEYMNLGSLDKIITKSKQKYSDRVIKVPENILSKIVEQILKGLLYLHKAKHQIHRDIKPANILINKKGEVKLTDFGIARTLENTIDLSKTFVGSKNFMSPERISGQEYSYSSDIWSLGLIIYEMCTGTFPFGEGNEFIELITKIINDPEPSLCGNDNFSLELQDFVARCLKKNPLERDTSIQLLNHPWIVINTGGEEEVAEWLAELYDYQVEK